MTRQTPPEETAVMATLETFADAWCAKDLDRVMDLFLNGEEISLIGTGSDELCAGRAAIAAVFARNFAEATATRFDWGWRHVAIHGDAATVAAAVNLHLTIDGAPKVIPLRLTVTAVKTGAGWKWVHRHASTADDTQAAGSAYPAGRG